MYHNKVTQIMENNIEIIGVARKYNGLAWKFIGGGLFYLAVIIAFLVHEGVAWNISLAAVCILGWIGTVPLYYGIKHLLASAVLIETDNQYIYIIHTRRDIKKIAMADVKSIFPSTQSGSSGKYLGGIEIKTNDGQLYIQDRIMSRRMVIQILANKIYENTGNKIDYYTLESLDGDEDI